MSAAEIAQWKARAKYAAGVVGRLVAERDEWKARAENAEARLATVGEHRAARCPALNRHLPHVWYDRTRTELPFEFACPGAGLAPPEAGT